MLTVLVVMGAITSCASGAADSSESRARPTPDSTTEPPDTEPPDTEPPDTEPPDTEPPDTEPQPVPLLGEELIGRWAHYDVVAYQDDVLKTLIISYGFNDISEVDGQIVDQSSFCFSEQRTDQPIRTSLSDTATQAIRPPPAVLEIDTLDGVLRVRRPATPTPVGIRLDDPFNEPLPTDPNDPRIVDDDGDGKPGLTVTIEVTPELIGELYIARREIFAFEALLTEPDLLTGQVTDDSEQLVIGASDPVFASSPANWGQYPDLSKSPVILRRVDADWDCERLAAERDDLFPPTPDVDW
jgi:hypothetical protein